MPPNLKMRKADLVQREQQLMMQLIGKNVTPPHPPAPALGGVIGSFFASHPCAVVFPPFSAESTHSSITHCDSYIVWVSKKKSMKINPRRGGGLNATREKKCGACSVPDQEQLT